jgi:hypothetical protein
MTSHIYSFLAGADWACAHGNRRQLCETHVGWRRFMLRFAS